MKIVYAARTFLDYRIPVFRELSRLQDVKLKVIYSCTATPVSVQEKGKYALGEILIGLEGEKKIIIGNPSRGLSNKWLRLPYQPGIIKTICNEKPDVVVGDGFFQWTFYLFLIRFIYKVPLVICYERTKHTERNAQWYRNLYRKIVVRFTSAICCSGKLCKEYTLSLGISSDHITLGHMVTDIEQFEHSGQIKQEHEGFVNRLTILAPTIRFLYVGSLIEKKGIIQLFDAWREWTISSQLNATLILAGSGYLEKELKRKCIDENLNNVVFLGQVDYDLLPSIYNNVDVFIIPTLEDNWSLVVPEAMAAGLPVCTSIYNGCWPELVIPGLNGWIFDPLDHPGIINTLESVTSHKSSLKKMGEVSKQIISAYTPKSAAVAIYDAVVIGTKRK